MASGKPNSVRTVVILGGGTAGTLIANRLVRRFPRGDIRVHVVDEDDAHIYQPGLLFVPFGTVTTRRLTRSRHRQLHPAVDFVRATIEDVDTAARRVHLLDAPPLTYDVLVIATGARLVAEETEGLVSALQQNSVHTFYDGAAATRLAGALADFRRGRLVVNVIDLPIKCPVAPLEFCFLADDHFRRNGVRDEVAITYATPLDSAFTKPVAARTLAGLLDAKGIELVTEFNTGTVDGDGRRLISYDGRELPFDVAVVVPLHSGSAYVQRSGDLGDEFGFVPVDEHTLQSVRDERVFAAGDAAAVPASKAGSVAHFEGEIVVANIAAYLAGEPLPARFDGHTNCFIETGAGKALLIDFNYDTEPVPGSFPGRAGLPLLRESRLNHLGKRAFEQLYWRVLLPGRGIPGIASAMPQHGKRLPVGLP
jgi:sulfide:quinone oxidoreductase